MSTGFWFRFYPLRGRESLKAFALQFLLRKNSVNQVTPEQPHTLQTRRFLAEHRRLLLYKGPLNSSKTNPAGEPQAGGGHACLAPGKHGVYRKVLGRKASVKCPPPACGSPASSLCVVQPAFISP
jgi:hypothetical protein